MNRTEIETVYQEWYETREGFEPLGWYFKDRTIMDDTWMVNIIMDYDKHGHPIIGMAERSVPVTEATHIQPAAESVTGPGEFLFPTYDSTADTLKHIRRVSQLLNEAAIELLRRANKHDESKLHSPEKELFDIHTPLLKDLEYGSDKYKASLAALKPALDHHYKENSHHPEHYFDGVNGFDLFDLIEMFLDWKAAGERNKDGNIHQSIEIGTKRFNIDKQIRDIFMNTADRLGW